MQVHVVADVNQPVDLVVPDFRWFPVPAPRAQMESGVGLAMQMQDVEQNCDLLVVVGIAARRLWRSRNMKSFHPFRTERLETLKLYKVEYETGRERVRFHMIALPDLLEADERWLPIARDEFLAIELCDEHGAFNSLSDVGGCAQCYADLQNRFKD